MKKIIIAVIALLFFGINNGYGESKLITSAANPWPPFADPDRADQGLSIEIIKAAFAVEGYPFNHQFMPWARAEHEVKNGKIDILPDAWFTDKRSSYLMFSKSYASNRITFIKRKGDPFEYKGIESLTGKTVGVINGYGYGNDFMNADTFTREEVTDLIHNLKKLVLGRIDLTLEDEIVAKTTLQKEPALLRQIAFVKTPLSNNDLHIACSWTNPRHEEIISAFNRGLEVIKANGTLASIFQRYRIE